MPRGTQKFTGACGMIVIVPIYAFMANALAQRRTLQHTLGLVQALCEAALGMARIVAMMPSVRWAENPIQERNFIRPFVLKPHPTRGFAATRPAGR